MLAQECALNAAALAAAAHQTDDATSAAAAAAWSAAAFAGTGRCQNGTGGDDDPTGAGLNLLLENPFDEIGALALLQAGAWEMEDEVGLLGFVGLGAGTPPAEGERGIGSDWLSYINHPT